MSKRAFWITAIALLVVAGVVVCGCRADKTPTVKKNEQTKTPNENNAANKYEINDDILDWFNLTHEQAIEKFGAVQREDGIFYGGTTYATYKDGTVFGYYWRSNEKISMDLKPQCVASDEFITNFDKGISADEIDEIFGKKQSIQYNEGDDEYIKTYSYKGYRVVAGFRNSNADAVVISISIWNN